MIREKNMVEIKTPKGTGKLHNIYVSELGFLMIKVELDDKTFVGYNLGIYNPEDNIFTKEILNTIELIHKK